MADLDHAVDTIVADCLGVAAGEDVVVVVDSETRPLGDALRRRAAEARADAVLALMDERADNGTEPPPRVASALAAADVFIAPTSKSLSHTRARKAASDAGARGATMPGVTIDMLARVMAVDLPALRARSAAVARALSDAEEAHVTCPLGSDLRLDLHGRDGISDDGDLSAPGAFGNLPCGEGFIAPAGGEGTVMASSLAAIGLASKPARLTVRDGRRAEATGPEGEQLLDALRAHHRAVFTLAGAPGQLAPAVLAGAREAMAHIDVSAHDGVHPRVGAVDVAPVVHLDAEARGAACAEALVLGDLLGRELDLPVLMY